MSRLGFLLFLFPVIIQFADNKGKTSRKIEKWSKDIYTHSYNDTLVSGRYEMMGTGQRSFNVPV